MITFNKAHIILNSEEITSKKLDGFIVMFNTPAKGLIESYLVGVMAAVSDDGELLSYDGVGNYLPKQYSDLEFKGVDILEKLHELYAQQLQELNPELRLQIKI